MGTSIVVVFRAITAYPITTQTMMLAVLAVAWIILSTIRDYAYAIEQPSALVTYLAFLFGILAVLLLILMIIEVMLSAAYRQRVFIGGAVIILIVVHILCRYAYDQAMHRYYFKHASGLTDETSAGSNKRHDK